ncbi:GNAT family N-acetyltransferase [Labrenzia sp. OB1]|uniref:GNAT family N-acetyltransferase n=1 Tax=Labrenzia sp. OB1 TaxID=1561204 RepID=UPI0007B23CB9|nr:GNAT family N-acetyltransferase [Labrenzia sp. OB1]KZM49577.1 acetyltransferase [Labrenzia sp. OB1]
MIRKATASDELRIRECAELAYARYVPLIGRKPAPMVADFVEQIGSGQVYIASTDEGDFQGFIVFYAEGDHILLENVAVLPRSAGSGVGKALIAFCEREARNSGKRAVRLYTNEKMEENLSIYLRLGYSEVARRCENGFNRVYFEKPLI